MKQVCVDIWSTIIQVLLYATQERAKSLVLGLTAGHGIVPSLVLRAVYEGINRVRQRVLPKDSTDGVRKWPMRGASLSEDGVIIVRCVIYYQAGTRL